MKSDEANEEKIYLNIIYLSRNIKYLFAEFVGDEILSDDGSKNSRDSWTKS